MSREFDADSHSYYTLPLDVSVDSSQLKDKDGHLSEPFKNFFSDIYRLANGRDHWVVLINQVARNMKAQLCFTTTAKTDVVPSGSTIIDKVAFSSAYDRIKTVLDSHDYPVNPAEEEFDKANPIISDLNTCFKPVGKRNLGVLLGEAQPQMFSHFA